MKKGAQEQKKKEEEQTAWSVTLIVTDKFYWQQQNYLTTKNPQLPYLVCEDTAFPSYIPQLQQKIHNHCFLPNNTMKSHKQTISNTQVLYWLHFTLDNPFFKTVRAKEEEREERMCQTKRKNQKTLHKFSFLRARLSIFSPTPGIKKFIPLLVLGKVHHIFSLYQFFGVKLLKRE